MGWVTPEGEKPLDEMNFQDTIATQFYIFLKGIVAGDPATSQLSWRGGGGHQTAPLLDNQ